MNRTVALVAFSLALGGCEKQLEDPGAGAAVAEVLPGSVSDAMLDIDQSRAQAPLAAIKPTVTISASASEVPSAEASTLRVVDTSVASVTPTSKPVTAPSPASATPKPKPAAR
jgi:hypothetical protein